ncbi:MAG: DUF6505 family protein [Rhodovibrionaceae bacterium]
MKLPRTIRLDASDQEVFDYPARPGEWAVSGSFAYLGQDLSRLEGKQRLAFQSGWLGLESFGRATLTEVAEISEAEFFACVERLARYFVESYGAPDLAAALPVARQELDDAAGLCEHKVHSLLTVERGLDEHGEILERFRVVTPQRAQEHATIWSIEEEEDGG